ncbi:MAG TPA: tRNA pseudouridine(38-40) synthase TruA [Chthoniobacterales bacterium]
MPNEKHSAPRDDRRRLKLIVAYDGAPFRGWQSQAGGETIQDRVETAFEKILGEKIRVHGAGRTDAGVHALGQCAHADVPLTKLAPIDWRNALNASLPAQIRIVRANFVSQHFHARFSARGKVYRYRIVRGDVMPPLEVGRAWHVIEPLSDDLIRSAAKVFCGTHDFARFSANRGSAPESTVRTIRSARVRTAKSWLVIEFDGDGFLYKMVRMMVGAIVRCASGKESTESLRERLRTPAPGSRFVAPACGLTLVRVRY